MGSSRKVEAVPGSPCNLPELGVADMVRAQPSCGTDGGVGVNALFLSDLEPEASALSWAGCGEPGERRLGLPSLPSGTPGLASQLTPPWPYLKAAY